MTFLTDRRPGSGQGRGGYLGGGARHFPDQPRHQVAGKSGGQSVDQAAGVIQRYVKMRRAAHAVWQMQVVRRHARVEQRARQVRQHFHRIVHATQQHRLVEQHEAGGAQPRWRGDGRELFFVDYDGAMMAATVDRGSVVNVGPPRKLFDTGLVPDPTVNQYAVTQDGQKFLVLEPREGFSESYSVVLNWPAMLK